MTQNHIKYFPTASQYQQLNWFHTSEFVQLEFSWKTETLYKIAFWCVYACGPPSREQATIKEEHSLCWLIHCCFLNIIKSGLLNSPKKKILPLCQLSNKFRLQVVSSLEVINLHLSNSSLILQFCFCLINNTIPIPFGLLLGQMERASDNIQNRRSTWSAHRKSALAKCQAAAQR